MSTQESIIFTHYATMLTLLDMGLNYTEIKQLSDREANMFLAMQTALQEFKNESMEKQAKMSTEAIEKFYFDVCCHDY